MKALQITEAPQSFVNFLMAMCVPFRWSYGVFIIENTHSVEKFTKYCISNGVRESDIERMVMTEVEL